MENSNIQEVYVDGVLKKVPSVAIPGLRAKGKVIIPKDEYEAKQQEESNVPEVNKPTEQNSSENTPVQSKPDTGATGKLSKQDQSTIDRVNRVKKAIVQSTVDPQNAALIMSKKKPVLNDYERFTKNFDETVPEFTKASKNKANDPTLNDTPEGRKQITQAVLGDKAAELGEDINTDVALQHVINSNKDKNFVQRIADIKDPKGLSIKGEKGERMSHLMFSYDNKVAPMIVQKDGQLVKFNTYEEAIDYAEKTGEFIEFPTNEGANFFAENYKETNAFSKKQLEKAQEYLENKELVRGAQDFRVFLEKNKSAVDNETVNWTKIGAEIKKWGTGFKPESLDKLRAEYEFENVSDMLVEDYLKFLEIENPERANKSRKQLEYIKQQEKNGEISLAEKEAKMHLYSTAIQMRLNAEMGKAAEMRLKYDIDSFNRGQAVLSSQANAIMASAEKTGIDLNMLKNPKNAEEVEKINTQISSIAAEATKVQQALASIQNENGQVTEENAAYAQQLADQIDNYNAQIREIQSKSKAFVNEDGTLKLTGDEQKAKYYVDQLLELEQKSKQLEAQSGVDESVIKDLIGNYEKATALDVISKASFLRPSDDKTIKVRMNAQRNYFEAQEKLAKYNQIREQAKGITAEAMMLDPKATVSKIGSTVFAMSDLTASSFGEMLFSSVMDAASLPKIANELLGNSKYAENVTDYIPAFKLIKETGMFGLPDTNEYNTFDRWSTEAQSLKNSVIGDSMKHAENFSKLPRVYRAPALLGDGLASVLLFATGGEIAAAAGMPARMGTFISSMAMTEGTIYHEAVDLGMDPSDAAKYSTMISMVTSVLETIVPDNKYLMTDGYGSAKGMFDLEFRKSIINSILSGKDFDTALRMAFKSLPESVAHYASGFTQESFEEIVQQIGGDLTQEAVNKMTGKSYYKDTFNADMYMDTMIGGGLPGVVMNVFNRPGRRLSPTQESVIGEASRYDLSKYKSIDEYLNAVGIPNDENRPQIAQAVEDARAIHERNMQSEIYAAFNKEAQDEIIATELALQYAKNAEEKAILEQKLKEQNDPDLRDAVILENRKSREQQGLPSSPVSIFEIAPLGVLETLEAIDNGQSPSNEDMIQTSNWLYNQYKTLRDQRKTTNRIFTIEEIDTMMAGLEEDITALENRINPAPATEEEINEARDVISDKTANTAINVTNGNEVDPEKIEEAKAELKDQKEELISQKMSPNTDAETIQDHIDTINSVIGTLDSGSVPNTELPDVEAKKADIESRRQEELEEKANRLFPVVIENTSENEQLIEEKTTQDNLIRSINAKYDAELAALEANQDKDNQEGTETNTEPVIDTEAQEIKNEEVELQREETVKTQEENGLMPNPFDKLLPLINEATKEEDLNFNNLVPNATTEDNTEQEPDIEAIESKATSTEKPELIEAVKQIDEKLNKAAGYVMMPVSEINTDEALFQNREKTDENRAKYIGENWKDSEYEPIHVWKNAKDNKYYVLSGHHRLMAAEFAGKKELAVKIFEGTQEEAENHAKDSNANRTNENLLERAKRYREKRSKGATDREVFDEAKIKESNNARKVIALSYLNPNGSAIRAFQAYLKSDDTTKDAGYANAEKIASFIGNARREIQALTNTHEEEMFKFLNDKTQSARFTRQADFMEYIRTIAGGFDFNPEQALNLQRITNQSDAMKEYDLEFSRLSKAVEGKETEIQALKDRFNKPTIEVTEGGKKKTVANPQYIDPNVPDYQDLLSRRDEKLEVLKTELQNLQRQKLEHQRKKGNYRSASLQQVGMFDTPVDNNAPEKKEKPNPVKKEDPAPAPKEDPAPAPKEEEASKPNPTENKSEETKKLEDELKSIWEQFKDTPGSIGGGTLMINPQKLALGVQLVNTAVKLGYYKLADMMKFLATKFGYENVKQNEAEIKAAYSAYVTSEATDEEADQMDDLKTIKKYSLTDETNDTRNENNDKSTEKPSDTNAVIDKAITTERKAKATKDNDPNSSAVIEEINESLAEINEKLSLLGIYTTDGELERDITETGSKRPEINLRKQVIQFSKSLATLLNYEHDIDKKNKPVYADTNIAPAGGDASFIIWKPGTDLGVYVSIRANRTIAEGLEVEELMWRFTSKQDKYRGFENNFISAKTTDEQLAAIIKREEEFYLKRLGNQIGANQPIPATSLINPVTNVASDPTIIEASESGKNTDVIKNAIEKANELNKKANDIQNGPSEISTEPTNEQVTQTIKEIKNVQTGSGNIGGSRSVGTANVSLPKREPAQPSSGSKAGQQSQDLFTEERGMDDNTNESLDDSQPNERRSSARDIVERIYGSKINFSQNPSEIESRETFKPAQRFNDNLAALETLLVIEKEGRMATEEEQATLSKYVGWGGLKTIIRNPENPDNWGSIEESANSRERVERLFSIAKELDPTGANKIIESIQKSTSTAFYTDPLIISSIWEGLKALGVKGSNLDVLEPSAGIGTFFSVIPNDLVNSTRLHGVEIDYLTAKILKQLYQKGDMQHASLQKANLHNEYYNVVIGNVPFAAVDHNDENFKRRHPDLKDKSAHFIHNYFFVRALEVTKPGGIVAMITSTGTMDTKVILEKLTNMADFVGAVRLPNTAFKGSSNTEVTSDIIILRKKGENLPPIPTTQGILGNAEVHVSSSIRGDKKVKFRLNRYWAFNPGNVIGEFVLTKMHGANNLGVTTDLSIEEVAERVKTIISTLNQNRPVYVHNENEYAITEKPIDEKGINLDEFNQIGNLIIENNKIYRITEQFAINSANDNLARQVGVDPSTIREMNGNINFYDQGRLESVGLSVKDFLKRKIEPKTVKGISVDKLRLYTNLRTSLSKTIYAMTNGFSQSTIEALQQRLNTTYDEYVFKYGTFMKVDNGRLVINKDNSPLVKNDVSGAKTAALEVFINGNVEKSKIFTENTIRPKTIEFIAKTPQDAVFASLIEKGSLDIAYSAQKLNMSEEEFIEAAKDFIVYDPQLETYVEKEAYLSGDVRKKLKFATENNMLENMKMLQEVLPAPIPAGDISLSTGLTWIPNEYYANYIAFLSGSTKKPKITQLNGEYFVSDVPYAAEGKFSTNSSLSRGKNAEYILNAALNGRTVEIRYGEEKEIDVEQTEQANEIIRQFNENFSAWLLADPERREFIQETYNNYFNYFAEREWNEGVKMTTPGMSHSIKLHDHQLTAIYRMVRQRGGILDHMVGAGKTFVIVGTVMELKRTGLAKKPLILALKAQAPQMAAEFQKAYPNAAVLFPSEDDFSSQNRKLFMAKIATNNWDAVILTHNQFEKIKQNPEVEAQILEEELKVIDDLIEQLEISDQADKAYKVFLKKKEKLEKSLEELYNSQKDAEGFAFNELGFDFVIVDESHYFKNLAFQTNKTNVKGLGSPEGNKKTMQLLTAIRDIQGQRGGVDEGVIFSSGTVVSNSLAELYLVYKYLRPNYLNEKQLHSFDSWAKVFAVESAELENYAGRLKLINRLRKFKNAPELTKSYREIADIRDRSNLTIDKPEVKAQLIKSESNPLQKFITQRLHVYMDNKGTVDVGLPKLKVDEDKNSAFGLLTVGYSRKASTDPRLIDPTWGKIPGGKIDQASDNIARIYQQWNEYKGVQLVFSDVGTPKSNDPVINLFDYLRNQGIEDYAIDSLFGESFESTMKGPKLDDIKKKMTLPETLGLSPEEVEQIIIEAESEELFNVYEGLKQELISKGVEEKDIAFIHDYNGDVKRLELYDKVNAGEIRVLIGSTPKMGVGVSVQQRVIALHHVDIPWRYSDVEQRNGRGERQGNWLAKQQNNNVVDIYFYATEGTLDTYMYNLNDMKGKMANTIKSKNIVDREVEDISDNLNLDEMAAELADDDDLKRKFVVDKQASALEKERAAKRNEYLNLEDNIAAAEKQYKSTVKYVELTQSALDVILANSEFDEKEMPKHNFKDDEGREIKGHAEYGSYLKAKGAQILMDNTNKRIESSVTPIGTINGLKVEILTDKGRVDGREKYFQNVRLSHPDGNSLRLSELSLTQSPALLSSNVYRYITDVAGPNSALKRQEDFLADLKENIDSSKRAFESFVPFDKTEELNNLRVEQLELAAAVAENNKVQKQVKLDREYRGIKVDIPNIDMYFQTEEDDNGDDDPEGGPGGGRLDAQIRTGAESYNNPVVIRERATNVLSAIRNINPNAKIIIHENNSDFVKAAKTKGQKEKDLKNWVAFHDPATGEIHISLNNMESTSIYHEGIHPVLSEILKDSPELINEFYEELKNIPEADSIREWANSNYANDGGQKQKVEAIIEYLATVADQDNIPVSILDKIRAFFAKLLNKIGITVLDINLYSAKDLQGFAKKLSVAFKTGNPIYAKHNQALLQALAINAQKSKVRNAHDQIKLMIVEEYKKGTPIGSIVNFINSVDNIKAFVERYDNVEDYVNNTLISFTGSNQKIDDKKVSIVKKRLAEYAAAVDQQERVSARQERREKSYNDPVLHSVLKDLSGTYVKDNWREMNTYAEMAFQDMKTAEELGRGEFEAFKQEFLSTTNEEYTANPGLATFHSMLFNKIIFYYRSKVGYVKDSNYDKFVEWEQEYEKQGRTKGQFNAATSNDSTPESIMNVVHRLNEGKDAAMAKTTDSGRTVGEIIAEIENQKPTEEEVDEAIKEMGKKVNTQLRNSIEARKKRQEAAAKKKEQNAQKMKSALSEFKSSMGLSMNIPLQAVPALTKLIRSAVDTGVYNVNAVKNMVWEELSSTGMDKLALYDDINEIWTNEVHKYAIAQQSIAISSELLEAINGKKSRAVIKNLVDAILSTNEEYNLAKSSADKMSALSKISILLQDKVELEKLLNKSLHIAEDAIRKNEPNIIDQATKISELRATVYQMLNQQGGIASNLIKEAFQNGEMNESMDLITQIVKRHYLTPDGAATSLAERLILELGIDQDFALLIESEIFTYMNDVVMRRREARINTLIQELEKSAKKQQNIRSTVFKILASGVGSSIDFQNAFGKYLGFKGVSNSDINDFIQLQAKIANMPDNELRVELVKTMNDIALKYEENTASFVVKVIHEFFYINALSNIFKTAVMNAGLGALATHIPFILQKTVLNLNMLPKAYQYRKTLKKQGMALTAKTYKEYWKSTNVISGVRDLQQLETNFKNHSAVERLNNAKWINTIKDVLSQKGPEKRKAIATFMLKALAEINGSGSKNKISTASTKFMGLSDLYMSSIAEDISYAIEVQKLAKNAGIDTDTLNDLLFMNPEIISEIENQVQSEIRIAINEGVAVPQGFAERRRRQLMTQNRVPAIMKQVQMEVLESLLMNKPINVGAKLYQVQNKITNVPNEVSWFEAYGRFVGGTFLSFVKTASNSTVKKLRGTVFGLFTAIPKTEYRLDDNNRVARAYKDEKIEDETGKTIWSGSRRQNQMITAMTYLAIAAYIINYLFDFDEEVDEKGKPILDEENNPVTRIRLKENAMFAVHGKGPDNYSGSEMQPGWTPNSIELKFIDNPKMRFIGFNRIPPYLVPTLKMCAEFSDYARYNQEIKYAAGSAIDGKYGVKKGYAVQPTFLKPQNVILGSAVASFDNDFAGYTKVFTELVRPSGGQTDFGTSLKDLFTRLTVQPATTAASPKLYESIEREFKAITQQEKFVAKGLSREILQKLWFADPFLEAKPGEEILDHFGNPIRVESDYSIFTSLISEQIFGGVSAHVDNTKEFQLFKEYNKNNEENKFVLPDKYEPNSVRAAVGNQAESVSTTRQQRREIANETFRQYGSIVRENYDLAASMDLAQRFVYLHTMYEVAKYQALKNLNYVAPDEQTLRSNIARAKKKAIERYGTITD